MPSIFTRIIAGELPGTFVWKDDRAVAMMTIAPIRPGHLLVIPRQEVDHWIDLPADLHAHLGAVSQKVGRAIQEAFSPVKVGLMIAGLEVRHVHLHLVPIHELTDLEFSRQDRNAKAEDIAAAASRIREALRRAGHAEVAG